MFVVYYGLLLIMLLVSEESPCSLIKILDIFGKYVQHLNLEILCPCVSLCVLCPCVLACTCDLPFLSITVEIRMPACLL